MKYKIPDEFMGGSVKGAIERALAKQPIEPEGREDGSINLGVDIDRSEYLKVPGVTGINGGPVLVSKYELQGFNNLNYEGTHRKLIGGGLYMPPPGIFMPHFKNVVSAKQGSVKLLDGNGQEVNERELDDIYNHLTKDHIAAYGADTQKGAWTWLNARFIEGTGFKGLDLETVIGLDGNGLKVRKEPLQNCVWKDKLVKLEFNDQGLAVNESSGNQYQQGQNTYFWHPRNGTVARFVAGSNKANLDCYWNPGNFDASLGVFGCAEGTHENSGGTK
jgi:hypothetical protein